MRKDFKFPSPPDSGLADIELPEGTRVIYLLHLLHPRTPKAAPPAPPLLPPPTIVVHAAKDSMNATPPPQRVDLPEVVLPDAPTPNSEGEPTPSGGRFIRLGKEGE